jgi:hypothetical protein
VKPIDSATAASAPAAPTAAPSPSPTAAPSAPAAPAAVIAVNPAPSDPTASSSGARVAQPIAFRKDDGLGAMALDVGLGLAVAIAVAGVVLFLLRRHLMGARNASGRRLRLLETLRLTPKSALFLVEFDGRSVLLGQQGDSLTVLDRSARLARPAQTPPPMVAGSPDHAG